MAEFWRDSASANEISIKYLLKILRFIVVDFQVCCELASGLKIKLYITWTFEILIDSKFALREVFLIVTQREP